jgi:hypothetical protein
MTRITESQWVNYFGFQRFPFDRPEAGNEEFSRPEFLASCFVEPKCFERVFGQADAPVTSLLFASRGTGKTACRVMMDYFCKNGQVRQGGTHPEQKDYILSVPHIHLDQVIDLARQASASSGNFTILVEHHAEEILRQAIPAFVDLVARAPELSEKVKELSSQDVQDLGWLIARYSHYLSLPQAGFLYLLGINPLNEVRPAMGFLEASGASAKPPPWQNILLQQRMHASPLRHLEQWCGLVRRVGILATYALVDGVDEVMESAESPQNAYHAVRPLLANLHLMDSTSYFALKFFLPSDIEPYLRDDSAFRSDRGFVIEKLEWREEDLVKILRERLNVLRRADYESRDRTAAGFDALCVPDLRGEIEQDLVQKANGNPRYLMNLCSQMVAAHCAREIEKQDDPFQLNREDYLYAIEVTKFRYHRLSSILKDLKSEEVQQSKYLEQEPALFKIGQMLDAKYEVRQVLPPGAAGQVYCVYDEVFERMCALKIFNNSSISMDSFRNEARSLLKISHPSIVQVYGWGVLKQSGRFYLISEFVDGKELTGYTNPGNLLPIQKAIQVILELLSALEYLHPNVDRLNELRSKMQETEIDQEEYEEFSRLKEQGLFHRDIKPSNLVLSPNGVKLIDFNIAAKATTAGQTFIGTEGYMLPETGIMRWSADGDLFATGIVAYELVTGHHPYPDRHPAVDIPPTNPLQYNSGLGPKLVGIILKAVSCDPKQRYHSARQFRQDLLDLNDQFVLGENHG